MSLADDFATHTGLTVRRRLDGDLPPLDRQTELVLYRVAQEGLTNAARHADAARVDLGLRRTPDGVVLSVEDDGRGVGVAPEGAGIRGMRERALLAGATLEVTRGRLGGALVTLSVPIAGKAQ
jgi:Signal transduction histidine kinase